MRVLLAAAVGAVRWLFVCYCWLVQFLGELRWRFVWAVHRHFFRVTSDQANRDLTAVFGRKKPRHVGIVLCDSDEHVKHLAGLLCWLACADVGTISLFDSLGVYCGFVCDRLVLSDILCRPSRSAEKGAR
jgi:hypothetical protein